MVSVPSLQPDETDAFYLHFPSHDSVFFRSLAASAGDSLFIFIFLDTNWPFGIIAVFSRSLSLDTVLYCTAKIFDLLVGNAQNNKLIFIHCFAKHIISNDRLASILCICAPSSGPVKKKRIYMNVTIFKNGCCFAFLLLAVLLSWGGIPPA